MIKRDLFEKRFHQLVYITRKFYPDSEISFRAGMWFEEEGYKEKVWENARKALDYQSWGKDETRRIIDCVIAAMGACGNLLSEDAYSKSTEAFLINMDKIAPVFYRLYQSGYDQDPECFEAVAKCVNNVYDAFSVAAYFFFLKDREKYSPVRKDADTKRLNQLGGKASCMLKCTWDNYMVYMDTVKELKDYLLEYIPDTTLLDAQSFLWMLHHIEDNTPESEITDGKQRILFCNVAWMEHYDVVDYPKDRPMHGGSYIAENESGYEEMNFHLYEDGYYYGYVETDSVGRTDENSGGNLHIERIESAVENRGKVDGVTIVFCAYSDLLKETVIVGWYKNASVYRNQQTKGNHCYNLRSKEGTLLPPGQRVFMIPHANKAGIGFGQSNIWFADEDNAKGFVKKVWGYIKKPFADEVAKQIGEPLTAEQWIKLIREGVLNEDDIKYLAKFYAAPNHAISGSDLGKLEGKHSSSYNRRGTEIGRKVSKLMNWPKMLWEDGVKELCFPVAFLGRYDEEGHYAWCVRPELAYALKTVNPESLDEGILELEKAEQQKPCEIDKNELLTRAKAGSSYVPVQYTIQTAQYRRNEDIVNAAKLRANGKCQLCNDVPFLDKQGNVFLEVHHLVWLSKGGADALENVVALCPNCHRKMHYNPDENDFRKLKKIALENII